MTRTCGNRSRTIATVPSREALSTTQVSTESPSAAAGSAARQVASSSRGFQVTMMMERSVLVLLLPVLQQAREEVPALLFRTLTLRQRHWRAGQTLQIPRDKEIRTRAARARIRSRH